MAIGFVVIEKDQFKHFIKHKKLEKELKKLCSRYAPVDPDCPTFFPLCFSDDFEKEVLKKIIMWNEFQNERSRINNTERQD